jgi:hypothetical protein
MPVISLSAVSTAVKVRTGVVDPGWEVSGTALLAEIIMLLAALAVGRGEGYFCTFAVSRPFRALTDMARGHGQETPGAWVEKLRDRQLDHLGDWTRGKPGARPSRPC